MGIGEDEVGRPHHITIRPGGRRPAGPVVDDGAEDVFLDVARRDLSGDPSGNLARDLPGRAGAT